MNSEALISVTKCVTKKWCKQRKAEMRQHSAELNRRHALTKTHKVTIKEAAWEVMEAAYLKASANDSLPAHARQIMYAARPAIQQLADSGLGSSFDSYFTQQLLPDYIEETGVDWNVVYDARGHFHEPHTKETVPLGSLQVRDYLNRVKHHRVGPLFFDISEPRYPTLGPKNRYSAILFIEKEGFMPLFDAVQLAKRFDLAVMSTKGMSVTASRELVDDLCSHHKVPLFVLHDFDKAGFSIVGTLKRNTRRYQFQNKISVIDLGLRMEDIEGLEAEQVSHRSNEAVIENLRANGATADEVRFLLHHRVELNAFSSDAFVAWIERKLSEQGVKKVVPDSSVLAHAYARAHAQALVQTRIDEVVMGFEQQIDCQVPEQLWDRVHDRLSKDHAMTWDEAVRRIAMADFMRYAS